MQPASAGMTAEEYPMAARQCSTVLTVGDEDDHSPGVTARSVLVGVGVGSDESLTCDP